MVFEQAGNNFIDKIAARHLCFTFNSIDLSIFLCIFVKRGRIRDNNVFISSCCQKLRAFNRLFLFESSDCKCDFNVWIFAFSFTRVKRITNLFHRSPPFYKTHWVLNDGRAKKRSTDQIWFSSSIKYSRDSLVVLLRCRFSFSRRTTPRGRSFSFSCFRADLKSVFNTDCSTFRHATMFFILSR